MTSVIPVVDRKVRVKGQRNEKSSSDDSTRAFLNFSRENLSLSQSDIENGFGRSPRCSRVNRQMLLSILAIILAVVCLAFEGVKIKKIVDNTRDIQAIKEELNILKQRVYEKNFLEELRAFEQQMYSDDETEFDDGDFDEDYEPNYDDDEPSQNNYSSDYEITSMNSDQTPTTADSINGDKKIASEFHVEKTSGAPGKNKSSKSKRHITENPPAAVVHREMEKKESTKKSAAPNNPEGIFPKKYYQEKRSRQHKQAPMALSDSLRGMARRNIRQPRQIFAAHYGAESTMFRGDDEHTGNGRARHNEGIFKAWKGSDWMDDLGMNRHFSLARDGRLTVHETGLYLVYAQIHYLDEHDENGFHVLVNGHPILQCMDYSPGSGHKSRSCFSAQVTYLSAGDRIVVKEVGPARYTLFQADKSFFGLAKLGDIRPPHQDNTRHNISVQSQTHEERPQFK